MKKIMGLFFLFFSISISVLGQKQKVSTTAEVSYLGKSEPGTIYLSSCGYNKKDKKTYLQAVRNAFETLIFRGIPGSEVNVPFVENETATKEANKKYFNDLFDDGRYKSFITSIVESQPTKEFKSKKVCLQMKINQVALRKDMEQNQVIRKFGY